jgi:hypothetical protein
MVLRLLIPTYRNPIDLGGSMLGIERRKEHTEADEKVRSIHWVISFEVTKRVPGFRSLRDAWLDTTSRYGRLMLTVLGA